MLSRRNGQPWETRFGSHQEFSLGVEEELLLIGPDRGLLERGEQVVRDADPADGELVGELFKAMVEANSEVAADVAEAIDSLRGIRRELLDSGSRLMAVGVHPNTLSGEAAVRGTPRFAAIEGDLRGILRTPICGQHIHVGLPDEESAVRAHNGIRIHIPLLNAISANSPFWFGEDSGLASARTAIFRSYPRNAMAPAFEDFADFTRVTREVCAAAGIEDYTQIWWDVRIHPGLGTVEVRAADAQFDLDRAAAITALVHCLTRVESESDHRHIPAREALAESSFQATRHGLDAELLDRNADLLPARELARRAVDAAGRVAGELGCEHELEYVERILDEGNGADLQRRVFREGSMDGLLAFLEAGTGALASRKPADWAPDRGPES